jgi:23S rRNA (guanine745-N1)-methyltransferase
MTREETQWRCANGHSFDIARQGHVNLLPVQFKKSRDPGDSREMVDARRFFLNSGAYAPLANRLAELCRNASAQQREVAILDAGCGDGYYLHKVCEQLDGDNRAVLATGLDISKWATRACASRYPGINALVASNRLIPLPDNSQDLLLCLFGFPVYGEFARVLKPGGLLVQVDAGPEHLIELRQEIYPEVIRRPPPSIAEAEQRLGPLVFEQALQFHSELDQDQLRHLLQMTPHIHRATPEARERIAALKTLRITADMHLRLLRKQTE